MPEHKCVRSAAIFLFPERLPQPSDLGQKGGRGEQSPICSPCEQELWDSKKCSRSRGQIYHNGKGLVGHSFWDLTKSLIRVWGVGVSEYQTGMETSEIRRQRTKGSLARKVVVEGQLVALLATHLSLSSDVSDSNNTQAKSA